MDRRPSDGLEVEDEDPDGLGQDLRWTGGKARRGSAMGARYTEGRFGDGCVSPPMDREATPMDWRSRAPPWCSNLSAWREGVRGRLWRFDAQNRHPRATSSLGKCSATCQDRRDWTRFGPGEEGAQNRPLEATNRPMGVYTEPLSLGRVQTVRSGSTGRSNEADFTEPTPRVNTVSAPTHLHLKVERGGLHRPSRAGEARSHEAEATEPPASRSSEAERPDLPGARSGEILKFPGF